MDISLLTIKVILLIVPGLLCTLIYDRLAVRTKKRSEFHFTTLSLLFGIISYCILQACCWKGGEIDPLDTFSKIFDNTIVPFFEILLASLIAIVLGFLVTLIDTYKLIERFALFFRISKSQGRENLYTFFAEHNDSEWVYVRDISNSLAYKGIIIGYNETEEFKELVLESVTVYDYPASQVLYNVSTVYLCLNKDNIKIETP